MGDHVGHRYQLAPRRTIATLKEAFAPLQGEFADCRMGRRIEGATSFSVFVAAAAEDARKLFNVFVAGVRRALLDSDHQA
jgi:hypothetical protein